MPDPDSPDSPLPFVLQPFASERMEAWEVSTAVEFVENDSPECIKPAGSASHEVKR